METLLTTTPEDKLEILKTLIGKDWSETCIAKIMWDFKSDTWSGYE